jgi:two-component system CheB/CheR fusion protein
MRCEYSNLEGRKLLVVDDSPQILALLREVFQACGARIDTIDNGAKAMVALDQCDYDLVILDLAMPSPNGWDVLEYARENCPQMLSRTVVLTAQRYDDEVLDYVHSVEIPALYKPFDLDSLRRVADDRIEAANHAAAR